MTTEEKQLLLKDLSARLSYGVIVSIKEVDSDRKPWFGELSCKDLDCFIHGVVYESIKPYLRPLSSMTEEERKECKHLIAFSGSPDGAANLVDWLNKKMFAYRTIDGKDMFKLGLALEAPEDMYKEE